MRNNDTDQDRNNDNTQPENIRIYLNHSPARQTAIHQKSLFHDYNIVTIEENEDRRNVHVDQWPDFLFQAPELPEIPGSLSRYKKHLQAIYQNIKTNEFTKAENTIKTLNGLIKKEPDTDQLLDYLDWMRFLLSIRKGDLSAIQKLPAETAADYCQWMLAIASAASTGTGTIPQSRTLELFCYRRASDAGSLMAMQFLAKNMLFGHFCPTNPATAHCFPEEALQQLELMAMQRECSATDRYECIINQLVRLIRHPNDDERHSLAAALKADKLPEIQLLAPMLYLDALFGEPDVNKAKGCLEPYLQGPGKTGRAKPGTDPMLHYWTPMCSTDDKRPLISPEAPESQDKLKGLDQLLNYWWAKCEIEAGNSLSADKGVRIMEKLQEEGVPAAIYDLVVYYQKKNEPYSHLFISIIKKGWSFLSMYPDLIGVLAHFKIEYKGSNCSHKHLSAAIPDEY